MGWTIIGIGFITWLALVLLFTPRIDYHVTTPLRPDSDDFLHVIQSTCQAAIHRAQPGRDLHQRRAVLSGDARRHPGRRGVGQPRGLHLPARRRRRHADRRDGRPRAGRASKSASSLDAIGSVVDGRRRGAAAARCGLPGELLPADALVPAAPAEQPDAPRAAGRRRPRRVHRRRRRRRLVVASRSAARRPGATRWRASKGRSWRRCRACLPRTGSNAAARS